MSLKINFSHQADADIAFFKKSGNKAVLKKVLALLQEISESPFVGTGKPELLKHELTGCWSKRISKEHRLVYKVIDDTVQILSIKEHYTTQ